MSTILDIPPHLTIGLDKQFYLILGSLTREVFYNRLKDPIELYGEWEEGLKAFTCIKPIRKVRRSFKIRLRKTDERFDFEEIKYDDYSDPFELIHEINTKLSKSFKKYNLKVKL